MFTFYWLLWFLWIYCAYIASDSSFCLEIYFPSVYLVTSYLSLNVTVLQKLSFLHLPLITLFTQLPSSLVKLYPVRKHGSHVVLLHTVYPVHSANIWIFIIEYLLFSCFVWFVVKISEWFFLFLDAFLGI